MKFDTVTIKNFRNFEDMTVGLTNNDWNASLFAKNINKILGKAGIKMKNIATVVNYAIGKSD